MSEQRPLAADHDGSHQPESTPALHGGHHAVAAAHRAGVPALFTLSGAHIFPLFDAAVGGAAGVSAAGDPRIAERSGTLRLLDVRHEQTAVFAAEAVGKLSRIPGFAAVTAGPGVTNAMSAVTGAWMNGSPLVLIGGRAPDYRWGSGALQELDHVPIIRPVTKDAWTVHDAAAIGADVARAFAIASSAHRGPVFIDIPMDVLFTPTPIDDVSSAGSSEGPGVTGSVDMAGRMLAEAQRPVVVVGSDVWAGDAIDATREFIAGAQLPTITNGMGRGVIGPQDPLLVSRARSQAFKEADVVVVIGAPLDFRLGYGSFGADPGASVIHLVDAESQVARHVPDAVSIVGDLRESTAQLLDAARTARLDPTRWSAWAQTLRETALHAWQIDEEILHADSTPIHPARVYGELRSRIASDDVVIGDGGDFVSFAGRFIEPREPGCWLDPGPFGCLGTGPGYALGAHVARPASHPWLLMGDGAAGFSLMDVETLVRHEVPVTIVIGNNSGWGLERHPMRFLYGYDVLADLPPTSYDEVVRSLGGAGETVSEPDEIGPALDRARAHNGPYVVNVLTDPEIAYPRSTTGI